VLGPYRLRDGCWQVEARGPAIAGGRAAYYFQTEREASKAAKGLRDGLADTPDRTLAQAIDAYLESLRGRGLRDDTTIREARYRLARLPALDTLSDLRRRHILAALPEGLAVATRRGVLSRMRDACRWWMRRGWLDRDPTDGIQVDGSARRGKRHLTRTEARRLDDVLLADAGDRATVVMLLLWTGLRSSEARRLRVRDLDLTSEPPTVQVRRGKTTAAIRTQAIPVHLAERLKVLVANRQQLAEFVFAAQCKEGCRSRSWVLESVHLFCKIAGVEDVCAHGLRGTWQDLARDAGVHPSIIAEAMGHANPRTGREHYQSPGLEERVQTRTVLRVIRGT
jgi:integrase